MRRASAPILWRPSGMVRRSTPSFPARLRAGSVVMFIISSSISSSSSSISSSSISSSSSSNLIIYII